MYDIDISRNKTVINRLGNKTAYEYDNSGRTTKVTSKKADGIELARVSYAYDTFNNMTEIVRGDGMKYTLAYNVFHNLESIGIEGKSKPLIKYAYKNGNSRLKDRSGIPRLHPHLLRHTFATKYLSNGGDIYTLQRILGHAMLDMVKKYLHLSNQLTIAAYRSPMDFLQNKNSPR